MTDDQLDHHAEAQFILIGLLAFGLLARLLLAGFSLVPWTVWIWLAIITQVAAGLAWVICLDKE